MESLLEEGMGKGYNIFVLLLLLLGNTQQLYMQTWYFYKAKSNRDFLNLGMSFARCAKVPGDMSQLTNP